MTARVLVVDDSLTVRMDLCEALRDGGLEPLAAATLQEARAALRQGGVAAVVLDLRLPDGDGLDLLLSLVAQPQPPPVLLLTSEADVAERVRGMCIGVADFVGKPYDRDWLVARVQHLIAPDGAGSNGNPRVLAVDDSLTFLAVVSEQMRRRGYDVVEARSGEEALAILGAQAIDGVLLDVNMPGLSGHETCRRIKADARFRDLPLLMLTALEDREALIEGINAGADDYVSKSAHFDVVEARLRAQLRRKQFEDENRRIREKLVQSEKDALEAKAARDLAATREGLLADLRKVNEDLLASKDHAERESHFKSRFLASMSHELRTPLNGIIGFTELLQDPNFGTLTPQQREFTDHVLQAARHLLALINDVLDLSKIEAGRLELQRQPVPAEIVIGEVLQVITALAQKRNVRIAVDVAPAMPDLDADPIRCKQALFNLVSNAVKFSPEGGEVVVSAFHDQGWVRITVLDHGPGIAQEDLPRLFREFEQIDVARRGEGTGLGLALTSRLTRLHGGRVDVHTELGKGSAFSLVWPAVGTAVDAGRVTM